MSFNFVHGDDDQGSVLNRGEQTKAAGQENMITASDTLT